MRKSQCQKLYPLCICHWCFHKILSAPYRAHSDWIHCVRSCVFSRRITRQHSVSVEVFCESTWGLDYLRNVLNGFGQARDHETWGLVSWASNNDNNDNNNSVWKIPYFFIYFLRPSLRLQCNVLSNLMNNYFYFRLLYIFCNKAFRFGPIWSGCMLKRWVCRASLFLNFSSHTLQRKGALTTSWTDLSLVLPAPAHTVLLISSRHSVTWHTRDQWHVG